MTEKKEICYSIIVPVKEINEYIDEHIARFKNFVRHDIELIVLPNEFTRVTEESHAVRFQATGKVSPAIKRDIGAKASRGKFLVFLDDDAFVEDTFFNVLDSFYEAHPNSAIGGPAITPKNSSIRQKASGAVYEDALLSSDSRRYVSKGNLCNVDDWPSVNFSIPKIIFVEAGGFDQNYWPGEDTMFCRKLISLGIAIFYDPDLIAYHHRRRNLRGHVEQVAGYGFHRGYFARQFPENSRKLRYFIPTIFILYQFLLWQLTTIYQRTHIFVPQELIVTVISPMLAYGSALAIAVVKVLKRHSPYVALLSLLYFPITHIVYGTKFAQGFFSHGQFRSKLR